MDHISQFLNEDGFELNGYLSQLFEKVSDNEDKQES